MAFNNTILARTAGAVWGVKLGNATTTAVLQQAAVQAGGLNAVINDAYNVSYGSTSNATVAAMVVANLGITGATATAATTYVTAQLDAAPAGKKGETLAAIANLFSGLTADPTLGAAATAFNAKVADAVAYAGTAGTADGTFGAVAASTSFNLGTGQDNMTGTAGDDVFTAYIINGANTLQDADMVNGGAGTDTLNADMGASQRFAVTPILNGVENVAIRAQSRASDSGDNNVASADTDPGAVQIDAQRFSGTNRFESNNSRADLIIEDVRIGASQITKDITIAMVSTDPGNVDYGVYFDQPSLRASSGNSSSLRLEVLDSRSAADGLDPLLNSPYDGVSFTLDGTTYTLQSQAINDATTFPALLTAIQAAIAANTALAGVTAAFGTTYTVKDSLGRDATGTSIVLSTTNKVFGTGNWIASAGVPANSTFHTQQVAGSIPSADLITSTIILDNVGRGSNGGDLVVGGLSVGESSTSQGVGRFNITVEATSRLQNIDSTANSLKEVVIVNGTTKGNLVVNGNSNSSSNGFTALPGATAQHDDFGFNDVRLIDASAMTGTVTFDATVTTASFAKYINVTDTQADPKGDNVSTVGQTNQVADFIYSGGTGNDSMTVVVDASVTASNSTVQVGREDFTFTVNGNAGNDTISLTIVNSALSGNLQDWYIAQKYNANVAINGGDGNDTVRTPGAGDVRIDLGAGNDTTYTDNTGAQANVLSTASGHIANSGRAMWTYNTEVQTTPAAVVAARDARDIRSGDNDARYQLYKATLEVTFRDLVSAPIVIGHNSGNFLSSDLHINQAIKNAINSDPVLSKLLRAEDGPGNSLVVKALSDGVHTAAMLSVEITAPDALTATEVTQLGTAWNITSPTQTNVLAAMTTAITDITATNDYVTALANDGTAVTEGAASTSSSDNTVTPGAGNDVIVLGTTEGASVLESSNEVIVFSGAFGNDTIVNFDPSGNGIDTLNFRGLGANLNGTSPLTGLPLASNGTYTYDATIVVPTFAATVQNSVYVQRLDPATASVNDTAAEIAAFYADGGTSATAERTNVYVAVDTATNIGTVWRIVDPVGASNVSATLMGTIDLADTLWSTLTSANFS